MTSYNVKIGGDDCMASRESALGGGAERLTPLGQLGDDLFVDGEAGHGFEARSLRPEELVLARLCVRAYTELQDETRVIANEPPARLGYEEYGKHTKIVDTVRVSSLGGRRRQACFRVTHQMGVDDDAIFRSIFMFDKRIRDVARPRPHDAHWLAGSKGDEHIIRGRSRNLADAHGYLQNQGYGIVGEIWAADINRHAGYLHPRVSFE